MTKRMKRASALLSVIVAACIWGVTLSALSAIKTEKIAPVILLAIFVTCGSCAAVLSERLDRRARLIEEIRRYE